MDDRIIFWTGVWGAPAVAVVYDCRELQGNPGARMDVAMETATAARPPVPRNDLAVQDFVCQSDVPHCF
jgi:hypothetical protein